MVYRISWNKKERGYFRDFNKWIYYRPGQTYKGSYNNNLLTKYNYMLCKEEAYFTPNMNEANEYTDIIKYNNYDLRVVFMCRINPHKVRITNTFDNNEYWLTNGKIDEVRPYRILFHFENKIINNY